MRLSQQSEWKKRRRRRFWGKRARGSAIVLLSFLALFFDSLYNAAAVCTYSVESVAVSLYYTACFSVLFHYGALCLCIYKWLVPLQFIQDRESDLLEAAVDKRSNSFE